MSKQNLIQLASLALQLQELEARRPCSINRLAKQAGYPMSTLMRELTNMENFGLIDLNKEVGFVSLTTEGRQFCKELIQNEIGIHPYKKN